jgi:hypothetical protein
VLEIVNPHVTEAPGRWLIRLFLQLIRGTLACALPGRVIDLGHSVTSIREDEFCVLPSDLINNRPRNAIEDDSRGVGRRRRRRAPLGTRAPDAPRYRPGRVPTPQEDARRGSALPRDAAGAPRYPQPDGASCSSTDPYPVCCMRRAAATPPLIELHDAPR